MRCYFCPTCGRSLSYGEGQAEEPGDRRRTCPACNAEISLRGTPMLVIGILVAFVSSLILNSIAPTAGACIGAVLIAAGVVQIVRQELALRRHRQ